jgi:ribosomal protein S18 acetylase RimI-like enzyme
MCAKLIPRAYQEHVDSAINDQYCDEPGALRFLKNIVLLPGCGQFHENSSFVVQRPDGKELVAAALTSTVSMGVGHVTQICVVPEYQGQGLGTRLMEAVVRALRSARFHALSLTVTSANRNAVALYERLGFHVLKKFSAGVWKR